MRGPDVPVLLLDIGRGTQDILLYTPDQPIENSVKMVLPSPNVITGMAIEKAAEKGQPVHLAGPVMGGGKNTQVIKHWLPKGLKLSASPTAALTIRDNLEYVQSLGVAITDTPPEDAVIIRTGDYMETELRETFSRFGIPYPNHLAVAVQDHGYSPNMSNRKFRFLHLKEMLERGDWNIRSLIQDPPHTSMTRMQAIRDIRPHALVMDTGAAAIFGALQDPIVNEAKDRGVTIVNAGNGHTLAVTIEGDEICGIFEHHSRVLMNDGTCRQYLTKLHNGTLTNEEVYNDHGHGAAVNRTCSPSLIAVTGPNRRKILPDAYQASPYGDMMLTGCFGLLSTWMKKRV
ncbi:DUF1786 domain-containing protein [Methanogenium organophilum]|uniref:DUF1786 domain-containing protein n=1 Tax=Methanogenium organophilum TaxID=2199 RepID=A0A9X9S4L1_METOG|nr:DUF1786 domain-containing protein [Methanogenium organophilum]WAI00800.1 DUF1786 domain-containing protein [Methanogenium organophilum]